MFIEVNISGSEKTFNTFEIDPTTGTITGEVSKTIPVGLSFGLGGTLSIADLVDIEGSFIFSFVFDDDLNPVLEVIVDAAIDIDPIGELRVTGAMRISDQGLVTHLSVALDAGFGAGIGLSFSASALLELNTSSTTQSFELADQSVIDVQSGFLLEIEGSVEFFGFAAADGMVRLVIRQGVFELFFDVDIFLGPITLEASGFAGIYTEDDPGIALRLALSLDVTIFEIFKIKASGFLEFNTRGQTDTIASTEDGRSATIAAQSFTLIMTGEVKILEVLTFDASFAILVGGMRTVDVGSNAGRYSTASQVYLGVGDWVFDFSANMNFFSIATLNASGWLNSDGHFNITVGGGIILGSSSFGLFGRADFHVYLDQNPTTQEFRFGVQMAAIVGARAFGITFAEVSIGFSLTAEGSGRVPVVAEASFSIKILFVRIRASFDITLGYVQLPTIIFLAGDQANEKTWSGGTLYLNMGDTRASERGIGEDLTNETFYVEHLGGSATGEKIRVIFGGREQIFEGVTKIVAEGGSGRDQIFVRPGVRVPVELHGGDDNDILVHEGSGHGDLFGDGGNDALVTGTATPTALLDAGSGDDYVSHRGTGAATIYGRGGFDRLFGGPAADEIFGGDDGDEIDGRGGLDVIDAGGGDDLIKWTISGALTEKEINPAALLDSTQPKFLRIDLWTINEVAIDQVDAGTGNDFLVITGTPGADTLLVSADTTVNPATLTVARVGGDAVITSTGVENLDIRAGDGGDTITIEYLGGTGVHDVAVDLGQNVVDTLRVDLVTDPDSNIVIGNLLFDDFAADLPSGGSEDLAEVWKQELRDFAVENEGFQFNVDADVANGVLVGAQIEEVTAGEKWLITDSEERELVITLDPVENVFDIRAGDPVEREVPRLIVSPDEDRDVITVEGSDQADNITITGRNVEDNAIQDVGIVLKDAGGTVVTDILVINAVRHNEGDTLKVKSFAGDDIINAAGLGDSDPDDDVVFPDLVALELYGGDDDDRLTGTPFNDLIDGGRGSDTSTGGAGLDRFFDASDANDIDTLIETQDADLALFENYFVTGSILKNLVDEPFARDADLVAEQAIIDAIKDDGVAGRFTLGENTTARAVLAAPLDGSVVAAGGLTDELVVDVIFVAAGSNTINAADLPDDLVTLIQGGATVTSVGKNLVSGDTYAFSFAGEDFSGFDDGDISIVIDDGWQDSGGISPRFATSGIVTMGDIELPQAALVSPLDGTVSPLDPTGLDILAVDVLFIPSTGATVDAATISDSLITLSKGAASAKSTGKSDQGGGIYRFSFVGADFSEFTNGDVSLMIAANWMDSAGQAPLVKGDPNFNFEDTGDRFDTGAVIEDLIHRRASDPTDGQAIFELAIISGGPSNNTIVVNDGDNKFTVLGVGELTGLPWQGRATVDNLGNEEAFVEHYLITIPLGNSGRIEIVDTGGTSGVDLLVVNGTNEADNLVLNAAGSGSFRSGQVVATEISNTLVTYRNVERVIIATFGGADRVLSNDTVVPTVINLGGGDDEIVIEHRAADPR